MNPVFHSGITPMISVALAHEEDIVTARQRARQISSELQFGNQDQVRLATAVSEIAREVYQHGRASRVEFGISFTSSAQYLCIQVSDPGRPSEQSAGTDVSHSVGNSGAQRLMDVFEIEETSNRGTIVRCAKALPAAVHHLGPADVGHIANKLLNERPPGAIEEVRRQNRELLETLEALRAREQDLERERDSLRRLNAEIEETNRGVVALYAELDEKAVALRRADELKSRFLSHVSHEFRTPLNSIMALSQILLDRTDGDLTAEQERQVGYMRRAAQDLTDMVNDLLDLAKVEAGKTEVHSAPVDLAQLFGALRGIMRPLAHNDAVLLIFEEPPAGLEFSSDEGKISQILRNLISNALKFTEQGEVRVSCRVSSAAGGRLLISVGDTGIGIAPADQERIFQEFAQVLNPLQNKVKGTGLGLPLSRKLAALLGGDLEITSTLGQGSTFTLTLPMINANVEPEPARTEAESILIIDDEETARYLARQLFRSTPYRVIEASSGSEGAERARFERPALILLDLIMPERSGFEVLDELKSDASTKDIPVVINTSRKMVASDYERLAGRQAGVISKEDIGRPETMESLLRLLSKHRKFGNPSIQRTSSGTL